MEKSSINIQPIKSNSESHNLRKTELDYVHNEYTHLNKSIVLESVQDCQKRLEKIAKEKTGRAMQKKATPIREGVAILGKKTTIEEVKQMCDNLYHRFNIKAIQVHIHEDEGHIKNNQFKKNRHAHIVFNWMDENTGKSIKLNKQDMAEFQTIVADSLNLVRGQSSDKKHLSAMEFKRQEEERTIQNLREEKEKLQEKSKEMFQNLTKGKDFEKEQKESISKLDSKKEQLQKEIQELESLKARFLSLESIKRKKELEETKKELEKAKNDIKTLQINNNKQAEELKNVKDRANKAIVRLNDIIPRYNSLLESFNCYKNSVLTLQNDLKAIIVKKDENVIKKYADEFSEKIKKSRGMKM